MKAHLAPLDGRLRIDGIRMDSVNNIANWDFVQEFKDRGARDLEPHGGSADKFLVVGEELSVPLELVRQNRLDGLWNEDFKRMAPQRHPRQQRRRGAELRVDGPQADRLPADRLRRWGGGRELPRQPRRRGLPQRAAVQLPREQRGRPTEERIKLAFACLLTAVGIPMIFAGDEFADQHDLGVGQPGEAAGRRELRAAGRAFPPASLRVRRAAREVPHLVDALAVNDTEFIHVDFNDGKRVLVWRRGGPAVDDPVVVVANFSDFDSGRRAAASTGSRTGRRRRRNTGARSPRIGTSLTWIGARRSSPGRPRSTPTWRDELCQSCRVSASRHPRGHARCP